jgi:hypothetical protein
VEERWASGEVAALLCNPFYAISIHASFAKPHRYACTEASWTVANARAISRLGPRHWLRTLLDVLQQRHVPGCPSAFAPRVADPYEAIMVMPALCLEHEPIVTVDEWIAANLGELREQSPEAWLANLLAVLKGAYTC